MFKSDYNRFNKRKAVYEMNLASGGERRFILVQLPEPIEKSVQTIAELTKERLHRVAIKIGAASAHKQAASSQLSIENESEPTCPPSCASAGWTMCGAF